MHTEAQRGRLWTARGRVWIAKTVKRPRQQPVHPQYANYWAPLTRKRHTMPHSAQPQHTNHWAPQTRQRHQQEHQPQRPTESSDPTQQAKGRTGDCPGPRKETTTRRNVTQGGRPGHLRGCPSTGGHARGPPPPPAPPAAPQQCPRISSGCEGQRSAGGSPCAAVTSTTAVTPGVSSLSTCGAS